MIELNPITWQDLQNRTALILKESGLNAQTNKNISIARGNVNIDVWAEDTQIIPKSTYIIECKYWNKPISKNTVHAFRTVVIDSGANIGLIISSKGFQKGCYEAAQYSNIKLFTWEEFQSLFEDRWFKNYMAPKLHTESDPLIEYTEPINSRIFKKADKLSAKKREEFKALREKYFTLAFCFVPMFIPQERLDITVRKKMPKQAPKLPLREAFSPLKNEFEMPDDILDAKTLRSLLGSLIKHYRAAILEFDNLFGERA